MEGRIKQIVSELNKIDIAYKQGGRLFIIDRATDHATNY